jgi:predicted transcriptional regulator
MKTRTSKTTKERRMAHATATETSDIRATIARLKLKKGDVAKRAGISFATLSLAVNDRKPMTIDLMARITAAIERETKG